MVYIIGEKDYKLEYSFEAVANEDCVRKTIELLTNLEDEEKDLAQRISIVPNTVISLFYAGLLENHAEEVEDEQVARQLLKQYLKENKDNEDATFYGIMLQIIEQMGEDGFLAQIGLTEKSPKKAPKTPQDRKKKATPKKEA